MMQNRNVKSFFHLLFFCDVFTKHFKYFHINLPGTHFVIFNYLQVRIYLPPDFNDVFTKPVRAARHGTHFVMYRYLQILTLSAVDLPC